MQKMQNLTQVQFTDSSRNSTFETDDIPFQGPRTRIPVPAVDRWRGLHLDGAFRRNASDRVRAGGLREVLFPEDGENPEDAIIADMDSDFVEGIKDEEEPYVRPEPYVRCAHDGVVRRIGRDRDGNRTVDVTKYVCYWPGAKATKEPAAEVKASNPATSEPAAEAEQTSARPVARPIVRDVIGASRTPRQQFRGTYGRTRPQPKVTPRRQARPQPKVQAKPGTPRMCANEKCHTEFLPPANAPNASLCRTCYHQEMQKRPQRICKCGTPFRAPSVALDAKLCPACYRRQREQEKRQQKAIRSLECERQARKDLELRIKRAIAGSGFLPEGAVISRNEGRQVIVLYKGESFTVYRPKARKVRRAA